MSFSTCSKITNRLHSCWRYTEHGCWWIQGAWAVSKDHTKNMRPKCAQWWHDYNMSLGFRTLNNSQVKVYLSQFAFRDKGRFYHSDGEYTFDTVLIFASENYLLQKIISYESFVPKQSKCFHNWTVTYSEWDYKWSLYCIQS